MRRRFALLPLALTAFSFLPATSAHAVPLCAGARVEQTSLPTIETNYMCIDYPYGADCWTFWYWDRDLGIDATGHACVPAVIGTPG